MENSQVCVKCDNFLTFEDIEQGYCCCTKCRVEQEKEDRIKEWGT